MFLLGKNMEELREVARETGLPPYAAKQMAHWIYERGVADIAEMTNLGLPVPQGFTISTEACTKY